MPLSDRHVSRDRLNFYGSLSTSEIESLVANHELRVLQTRETVDLKTCDLLNARFFAIRPDVELRVYGHYGETCNLSFLSQLPQLRRLAADCLGSATGAEHINSLGCLERLSLGIYGLESFEFLGALQAERLTHLSLGATLSKKPSLRMVERLKVLESLSIDGHTKEVEVISTLSRLEKLTLRSVTLPSLAFMRGLVDLWSLEIKLGGTKNLEDLPHILNLKYLELWQVKGLSDVTPIANATSLQFLFLQALRNVTRLPDLSRLSSLRRIYLENMKGLDNLTALTTAPVLEELIHVSAQGREPAQYAELLNKGTLKRLRVGFGSAGRNEELAAQMREAGVEECGHRAFQFA
jgi:hypothetical protein